MSGCQPSATAPPANRAPVSAVAVVIPAHNEQELLGSCLDALDPALAQARETGLHVFPLVVADACTDATRTIARARGAGCLLTQGHNVGAARGAGSSYALAALAHEGFGAGEVYLLHTDADCLVPSDWITRHVRAAAQHDAVLGPVEIRDWSPRGQECARRYARASAEEPDNGRVHGANLGVRAQAYVRVAGFPTLPVAEDRAFVHALRAAGDSVVFRPELSVCTSARLSQRVPGGFSDYLSELDGRC